jgi:hypothetical protein
VSAKRVIPDPVIETNCPSHTIENPSNPEGRCFGCLRMEKSSIPCIAVLHNVSNA